MIWTRWLTDYRPEWNKRSKLESESERNLETGELVWLVDEFLKRSDYKMARVIETFPGSSDGIVRSATVKTNTGTYKRPVVKLAPLFDSVCFPEENRAGDVGASSETRYHTLSYNCQNSFIAFLYVL